MSLQNVLVDELRDLYSAENQLVKALPKLAKGAKDPALKAIQGRGPRDERLAEIRYGGRVFSPAEVADLSAALDTITDSDLRTHFDPQVMEDFDVAGFLWTEEEPDVLDAILIPIFNRLRAFYGHAARAAQYVLVVHS